MSNSLSIGSASGIHAIPVAGLDIETALMAVQSKRAELLETQLKGQLEEVQARNQQISKLNDTLTAARRLQADFKSDDKSTKKINDVVKDGRSENTKKYDDAVWKISGENSEIAEKIKTSLKNGEANPFRHSPLSGAPWMKETASKIPGLYEKAQKDTEAGTANPRADRREDLKKNWSAANLGEFNISNKGQLDTAIENIKSMIDSLSNSQQMDMLRLQSLTNKRNEAFELMTNFIKKMQDGRSSIMGNMR